MSDAVLMRLRRWRDAGDGPMTYTAGSADFAADVIVLLEEIERLRRALEEARFAPQGDNHHNALACPYCNPEGKAFEP